MSHTEDWEDRFVKFLSQAENWDSGLGLHSDKVEVFIAKELALERKRCEDELRYVKVYLEEAAEQECDEDEHNVNGGILNLCRGLLDHLNPILTQKGK